DSAPVLHHFRDAKLDGRRSPVPSLVGPDVAGAGDFPNRRGRNNHRVSLRHRVQDIAAVLRPIRRAVRILAQTHTSSNQRRTPGNETKKVTFECSVSIWTIR